MISAQKVIPKELIKDLDSASKQLVFYRNATQKPLPQKLANRIAYLRGYANCIRYMEALEANGQLPAVLEEFKNDCKTRRLF